MSTAASAERERREEWNLTRDSSRRLGYWANYRPLSAADWPLNKTRDDRAFPSLPGQPRALILAMAA